MSFQEHQAHKNKNFMTSAVCLQVLSILLKSLYLMCIGLFNSSNSSVQSYTFTLMTFGALLKKGKRDNRIAQ